MKAAERLILLVEDNPDHLELIQRTMARQEPGFKLMTAPSIRAAQEALRSHAIELVITDWRLPDGEGQQLLPSDKDNPAYCLVIMTSHGNEQLAVEVMKNGALDYIVKSPESLMQLPHLASRALREWDHIQERRKAEAEKQILERRLNQSQKLEAIGTLAGGIAHDFNNILSGILGYAELMQLRVDNDTELGRHIQEIKRACLRAADLVRQILTFSRQAEPEIHPLKIQYVLKEALKLLRGTIPSTIEFDIDIDMDCPPVLADSTQIHQVLTNLSTNAYHAMEGGMGRLGVRLRRTTRPADPLHPELAPGEYVELQVSDTGKGIDPTILERIFDPFFTTKGPGRGTGLGLSTVHGIVTQLHGLVLVESQVGAGSVFTVLLPAASDEEEEALPLQAAEPSPRPRRETRILYVDDEPMLVQIGRTALERQGFQVEAFTESPRAWEAFQTDPSRFHLVVADQTMPQITGLELMKRMRGLKPELPVILCSGYSEALNDQGQGLPNFIYLRKPLILQDLIDAVLESLQIRD